MSDILMIIPYRKLFPPQNGGTLRCFYLLRELAKNHHVHCILLQPSTELETPIDGYTFPTNVKVYSPEETPPPRTIFSYLPKRLGPALQYRWLRRQWQGSANSLLLETYHLVSNVLENNQIEAVIYETLVSVSTATYIQRIATNNFTGILDATNVEHIVLEQESASEAVRKQTFQQESNLKTYVDTFFACSAHDHHLLEEINQQKINGFIIPNGVDTVVNIFDERTDKHLNQEILFCGSLNWPPNRDGLLWFYTSVWPLIQKEMPSVRLRIVGKQADKTVMNTFQNDPTINFIGFVPEVKLHYSQSGVAIAPLHKGSGTRLKILEAMSFGNPVVSTHLGAQGLGFVDGESILYADSSEDFAKAVLKLLTTPTLFDNIRQTARSIVSNEYDWNVVGIKANKAIEHALKAKKNEQS